MANTVQLPGTQLGLDENVRIGPGLKRNHYDGSIHVTEVCTKPIVALSIFLSFFSSLELCEA